MASTAQRLKDDSLYKQLGELGRAKYPLDPVKIERKQAVCNCLAIRTRAGLDFSDASRATIAVEVIETAIASITDLRLNKIAFVIFGLGDYKNELVGKRMERLYEREQISTAEFSLYRADAIAAVMSFLKQPLPPVLPDPGDLPDLPQQPRDVRLLTSLAHSAAALYCGVITLLYLAVELRPDEDRSEWGLIGTAVRDLFADLEHFVSFPDYLCRRCLRADYYSAPQTYSIDKALTRSFNSEVLKHSLPADATNGLRQLYRTLASKVSPFTHQEVSELSLACGELSYDFEKSYNRRGALQSVWTGWCARELTEFLERLTQGSREPTHLEGLAAKSGRIVQVISEHIELRRPVLREAEWLATKKVVILLRRDEWMPHGDGKEPLGKQLDRFFENTRTRLAKNSFVWLDK